MGYWLHMRRDTLSILPWFFALSFAVMGCSMPIQGGLSEREANDIIVLLSKATPAIHATKQKNAEGRVPTWDIIVPSSDGPRAIGILQANNLPRKKDKGFDEIYGKSGMIPTATEERAKFMMALTGELQRTIKFIPGVLNARVHLNLPKDKLLRRPGEKQPLPKASVSITAKTMLVRNKALRTMLVRNVQKIVSGSMERMLASRVNVVIHSTVMAGGGSADGAKDGSSEGGTVNVVMFRVAAADANKLKIALAAMVLLLGVFIVLFLLFFFRAASLKNQIKAAGNGGF
jgi:type III secretion protein J